MLFLARLLIASVSFGYAFIQPIMYEFQPTHLFNPDWTPHSKFHLMWSNASSMMLSLFAMYMCLFYKKPWQGTLLAFFINFCHVCGFWVAVLTRSWFEGTLYDRGCREKTVKFTWNGIDYEWERSLVGVGATTAMLLLGFFILLTQRTKQKTTKQL